MLNRRFVTQRQVLPQIARQVTHMLVRHLDADCLRRILESPLAPDYKFKVAFSKLVQQQPWSAHLLQFHMDVLRGCCPLTSPLKDVLIVDETAAAMRDSEVRYLPPSSWMCWGSMPR